MNTAITHADSFKTLKQHTVWSLPEETSTRNPESENASCHHKFQKQTEKRRNSGYPDFYGFLEFLSEALFLSCELNRGYHKSGS